MLLTTRIPDRLDVLLGEGDNRLHLLDVNLCLISLLPIRHLLLLRELDLRGCAMDNLHTHIYVCMYICIYEYTNIHTHTHTHTSFTSKDTLFSFGESKP